MERINIYITKKQKDGLKKLANESGMKFAELVRQAIYQFLKRETKP